MLYLSQPAISAQMKRLQRLVGGDVFTRNLNAMIPTNLSKLVIQQSRRIIDANDQILRLGGSAKPSARRLGISQLLAAPLFETLGKGGLTNVFGLAEHSSEIRRGLGDPTAAALEGK